MRPKKPKQMEEGVFGPMVAVASGVPSCSWYSIINYWMLTQKKIINYWMSLMLWPKKNEFNEMRARRSNSIQATPPSQLHLHTSLIQIQIRRPISEVINLLSFFPFSLYLFSHIFSATKQTNTPTQFTPFFLPSFLYCRNLKSQESILSNRDLVRPIWVSLLPR